MADFSIFGLNEKVNTTLQQIRFKQPTDIQKTVIPLALKGKDIIGRSETGSGKTHAFLLPIINRVDPIINQVQAIILAPTRELALQIYQMTTPFIENIPGLKVRLISGGLDRSKMLVQADNTPQIIIGTPGRIVDIAFTKALLNITNAKMVVLDEADMILESGFLDEVGLILSKMKESAQVLVFSATMPQKLIHEISQFMHNPEIIDTDKKVKTSTNVQHIAYPTRNKERKDVMFYLMNNINPYLSIIFASRKETVDEIYQYLREKGANVGIIHGDLDPTTRRVMMKRIRNNEFRYIVASDIAARGIDIDGVSHIINYDLPYEQEFYFHRAGRTGRGEYAGICFSLYTKDELKYLERLHQAGVNFENKEYQGGQLVALKPLFATHASANKPHPQQKIIDRIINESKKKPVKPGYKKKRNEAIDKVKRKYRRELIDKDIKRQIKERAIKKSKAIKEGENYEQ